MTSVLGNPSFRFGDSLISHVLPRAPVSSRQIGPVIKSDIPSARARSPYEGRQDPHQATRAASYLIDNKGPVPLNAAPKNQDPAQPNTKGKRKLSDYYKSPVRRLQCRTNQARYRNRQREYQAQLEQNTKQLRQEVGNLKCKYRDLSSRERSNQSPWSIVAEVFRLIESSFRSPWRTVNSQEMQNHKETRQILAVLKRSFVHDAAIGGLHGIDTLLEQLRHFSQYFSTPQLELVRVETVAPGVMAARAKLGVTVSELSLKHVFVGCQGEQQRTTRSRLLKQRLEFDCTMNFLFDEGSCRVVRLECKIDLVAALLRLLGNLNDVSDVLEHALITSECTVEGSH